MRTSEFSPKIKQMSCQCCPDFPAAAAAADDDGVVGYVVGQMDLKGAGGNSPVELMVFN